MIKAGNIEEVGGPDPREQKAALEEEIKSRLAHIIATTKIVKDDQLSEEEFQKAASKAPDGGAGSFKNFVPEKMRDS